MKFESKFNVIRENSLEDHENILQNKMLVLSLEYADRVFKGETPPNENSSPINNIQEFISKHTLLKKYLRDGYFKRIAKERKEEDFDLMRDKFFEEVELIYKNSKEDWINKVIDLADLRLNEAWGPENTRDSEKDGNKEKNTQLFYFGLEKLGRISKFDKKYGEILRKEISELSINSAVLEIHFQSFFKQASFDKEKKIFSIEESLKNLAIKIVDNFPEAKAVIGRSWLLDTPIAQNIGFNIYKRDRTVGSGESFWGQFIDKDGQIKEKEIFEFLKTGNAKYGVGYGYFRVEEFLKKYLPKERKGKIILKDIDESISEKISQEQEILKKIIKEWGRSPIEDYEHFFEKSKYFSLFLNTEEGRGFDQYLIDCVKNKKSIDEMQNDKTLHKYKEALDDFFKKCIYVDREVII